MRDALSGRMLWRVVDPEQWATFLSSFGARHAGWLVRLGGTLDTPRDYLALRELRLERGDRGEPTIVIGVGEQDEPSELRLRDPRIIEVEQTVDGVERGLSIIGDDDDLMLRFRTTIAPELVDGPPM